MSIIAAQQVLLWIVLIKSTYAPRLCDKLVCLPQSILYAQSIQGNMFQHVK